jgi:ribosomal protein S18 acetylase RimI-like enzyme
MTRNPDNAKNDLCFRTATPAHENAIRSCIQNAYEMYVERMGRQPAPMLADYGQLIDRRVVHTLEHLSKVVGLTVMFAKRDYWFVETIAVDPAHQGLGLGRALMRHAEAACIAAGFDRVELYTNEKMTENIPFYLGLGYEITEHRHEDGFNRVFFRKRLGSSQVDTIR